MTIGHDPRLRQMLHLEFQGVVKRVHLDSPELISLRILFGKPYPRTKPSHCPVCNCSREHVTRTGDVGCPVCYEVFDENIRKILGAS